MDTLDVHFFADAAADKAFFDGDEGEELLNEMIEWEFLADKAAEDSGDEKEKDQVPPPAPPAPSTVVVQVNYKNVNVAVLKEIVAIVYVSQGGTQRVLFDKILTSGRDAEQVDANTFKYSCQMAEGEMPRDAIAFNPATWVNLRGEPVAPVAGVNMSTDVPFGLFGPTN
jgi:hypothetical protein